MYTAARVVLFVACYAGVVGVYLLLTEGSSVPLIWPFVVAAVISAVGSYYLLRGPRERFAAVVQHRAEKASARFEQARAKEDDPDA